MDGEKAVRAAADGVFDLVLMDLAMPVMDGLQAARRLRRDGVICPIIAVTAHGRLYDLDGLVQLGFDDLILKPVTVAPIAKAFSMARATRLH